MGPPEIPTSGRSTLKKLKSQLPLHRNLRSVRQQNPSVAPKLQQAACGIPSCGLNHNTFLSVSLWCLIRILSFLLAIALCTGLRLLLFKSFLRHLHKNHGSSHLLLVLVPLLTPLVLRKSFAPGIFLSLLSSSSFPSFEPGVVFFFLPLSPALSCRLFFTIFTTSARM